MKNRILRFIQKPRGVFHVTVFHQYQGGFGPSAIACTSTGDLYVARSDPVSVLKESTISVIGEDGKEKNSLKIQASDIRSLIFDAQENYLYACCPKVIYKHKMV